MVIGQAIKNMARDLLLSLMDITILWETDTFHERAHFLKLPGYSRACQLTGAVFRLLLLAESSKPPNETEICFFFRALEYGILSLSKSKTIIL